MVENQTNKFPLIALYKKALEGIISFERDFFESNEDLTSKFSAFEQDIRKKFEKLIENVGKLSFENPSAEEHGEIYEECKNTIRRILQTLLHSHGNLKETNALLKYIFDLEERVIEISGVPFFPFRFEDLVHQFNVFAYGLTFLDHMKEKNLLGFFQDSFSGDLFLDQYQVYSTWLLTSLFHDFGKIFDISYEFKQYNPEGMEEIFKKAKLPIDMTLLRAQTYPIEKVKLQNLYKDTITKLKTFFKLNPRKFRRSKKLLEALEGKPIQLLNFDFYSHGLVFGCLLPKVLTNLFPKSVLSDKRNKLSIDGLKSKKVNMSKFYLAYSWATAANAIVFHHNSFQEFIWKDYPFICLLKICNKLDSLYRITSLKNYYNAELEKFEISNGTINLNFRIEEENLTVNLSEITEELTERIKEFNAMKPLSSLKKGLQLNAKYDIYRISNIKRTTRQNRPAKTMNLKIDIIKKVGKEGLGLKILRPEEKSSCVFPDVLEFMRGIQFKEPLGDLDVVDGSILTYHDPKYKSMRFDKILVNVSESSSLQSDTRKIMDQIYSKNKEIIDNFERDEQKYVLKSCEIYDKKKLKIEIFNSKNYEFNSFKAYEAAPENFYPIYTQSGQDLMKFHTSMVVLHIFIISKASKKVLLVRSTGKGSEYPYHWSGSINEPLNSEMDKSIFAGITRALKETLSMDTSGIERKQVNFLGMGIEPANLKTDVFVSVEIPHPIEKITEFNVEKASDFEWRDLNLNELSEIVKYNQYVPSSSEKDVRPFHPAARMSLLLGMYDQFGQGKVVKQFQK